MGAVIKESDKLLKELFLSYTLSFLSGRVQDDALKQQSCGGNVQVYQGVSSALSVNMAKGGGELQF